jgi:hypothetical protein
MYWLHKSLQFLMNCHDNVNPIARQEITFHIHAGPLTAMASDPQRTDSFEDFPKQNSRLAARC